MQPYKNYLSEFEQLLNGDNYISPKDFVKYVLPLYTPKMAKRYRFILDIIPSPISYMSTDNKYYNDLVNGDPEKVAGICWRLNKYLGKKHEWRYTRLKPNGVMTCRGRGELHDTCQQHGFEVNGKNGKVQKPVKKDIGWYNNNHPIKPQ